MSVNLFDLNSYDFELPQEFIATRPLSPRDHSRLMVVDRASGKITHKHFYNLPEILGNQSHLVVNNTQVIRSRLLGRRVLPDGKVGGDIEFLLLEQKQPLVWEGIMRSTGKQTRGFKFEIAANTGVEKLIGELISGSDESPEGVVVARFNVDPLTLDVGEMPLPPYLERSADRSDEKTYQTVYASDPGSSAAPTAGLHFTTELMSKIQAGGVGVSEVTLNVGLGTFRPVKVQDIREHQIHSELVRVSEAVAGEVNQARLSGKKIVAVGTTSLRTLESAASESGILAPMNGRTSIYIYPGYKFKLVDQLITNFHLPKSSLMMLVSAIGGYELMREAYREAIREKYRFFSYGDAMVIL
ncbi:MAG: tRNA preQ1(34) S-adenosylmethionine ribosyltransferase-isomerase QueA [Xanthomonadaceae bacterium]|nr:tRNA preQ1(34) S-adenosylmethionine ribosyltransferase-isomerase QueA [Xanthomonadaceae bacterium]